MSWVKAILILNVLIVLTIYAIADAQLQTLLVLAVASAWLWFLGYGVSRLVRSLRLRARRAQAADEKVIGVASDFSADGAPSVPSGGAGGSKRPRPAVLVTWIGVIVGVVALGVITGNERELLISFIVGAIGGALGMVAAFGVWRLGGLKNRWSRARGIFAGVGAVAFLQPPVMEKARAVAEAISPTAQGRFLAQLEGYPAVKKWVLASASLGSDEVRRRSAELSAKGIRKLDDDMVVRRAAILAKVLDLQDEAACANLARGVGDASGALSLTNAETRGEFQHIAWSAMDAQLRGLPDRTYREAELEAAIDKAVNGMPDESVTRLAEVLRAPANASDRDLCWAWRTLHVKALGLSGRERLVIAAMLAGVQPSP